MAVEFEKQMTGFVREYKGDGEYLSVQPPDIQGALNDAPGATALILMGAARGTVRDTFRVAIGRSGWQRYCTSN